MRIEEGQEELYVFYKELAQKSEKAKLAFEVATNFADTVETIIEKYNNEEDIFLPKVFEQALNEVKIEESITGAIKNAAHIILTKTWEYGTPYEEYTRLKEDGYYHEIEGEMN